MRTDEELAKAYAKGSDYAALQELRVRVQPIVHSQVNRYVTGPGHISRAALEARADELFVDAAKTYDPKAGAAFRTHLFNGLRRLDRYVKANANVAYIPEARASNITLFNTRFKTLEDEKRRPPTDEELADDLMWSLAEVQRMRRSMRRELPWSQVQSPHQVGMEDARNVQLLDDVYHELSPDERMVFEFITGRGRPKITKGQDLAKKTGFSQAKVSQLRKRIAERLKVHL